MASIKTVPSEVREHVGFEFRAEASGSYLHGIVTTYGDETDVGPFREVMAEGVFDASLSRNADKIPLLLQHDAKRPAVAKVEGWERSDKDLSCVWKFGTHQEARDAAQLCRESMLTGLSVGFQPGKNPGDNTWDDDDTLGPKVTRHNARLLEVSLVTVPANPGAGVTSIRTAGAPRKLETPRLDEVRAFLSRLG